MSPSQPFGLLLEELRRAGHPIGVWDALMVRRLADRYSGASREEIRDALAALLGKDVEGQERVRQAFERAFPAQAPVPPPPLLMHEAAKLAFPVAAAQTREAPRVKGGRPLTWGLPIGFASVGLWLVLAQPFIGTSLPPPPGVDAGVSEPDAGEPEVAEPDAGAPSQVSPPSTWRGVPSAWGGVGAGVLVLAVAGVLAHRRYSSGRAAREALAAKAGPEEYRLPDGSRADRRSVTELAAMLASCSGARRSRRALDVAASVRRTANRAGYAEPVYARRRGEARLLVLREVGPTMQPWDWSVDQILKGLRAEGLRFELMFFSGNPDWLSERRLGRAEALSTVARERADRVVLVIGSGELLGDDWKVPPDLRGFAACAWLTPVDDPALWPPALRAENNGILVWGASPSGLLDLGRHLARGEPPSVLRQRRLAPVEANLLRAFVALSPRRTWELAHRLKRRFLPDAPDTAVLAVRSLLDEGQGGVEELRAAQELLRRIDTQPGRPIETSVRAFIEAELRRGEPTERESIAHLRWRKDLALVRLAGGDAKGEAFAELAALAQTVIGHEVARWREPWLEAHAFVLGRAERRQLERLSRVAGRKASPGGGRWRWPGAVTFAAAAVAGVVAFYALASVLQKPREVEHVFGVVVINREIAVSLDAPVELAEDLGLYEGGTLLRTLPGSRESLHGRGAFLIPLQPGEGETLETLEVGARLTDGRFGVGVPVTPPRATLTVLAVDPSGKAVIEGTAVIACGQRVVTGRLGERMGVEGGACLASVLVGPEFEGGSREVNVPAGSASEVQIQLQPRKPPPSELEITRLPAGVAISEVELDGKRLTGSLNGATPGRHTVRLTNPYFSHEQAVEVTSGRVGVEIDAKPVFGIARVNLEAPVSASAIRLEGGLAFVRPPPPNSPVSRFDVRGRTPGRVAATGFVTLEVPIRVGRTIELTMTRELPSPFAARDAGVFVSAPAADAGVVTAPPRAGDHCDVLANILRENRLTCIAGPRDPALDFFEPLEKYGRSTRSAGTVRVPLRATVSVLTGAADMNLRAFFSWLPDTRFTGTAPDQVDVEVVLGDLTLSSFEAALPAFLRNEATPQARAALTELCKPGTAVITLMLSAKPTVTIRSKQGVRLVARPDWANVTGPSQELRLVSQLHFAFAAQERDSRPWLAELCEQRTACVPRPEVCDGEDNDCDGRADPLGVCPEVVIWEDKSGQPPPPDTEVTMVVGPESCGQDDRGRPYTRTRVMVRGSMPKPGDYNPTCTTGGFVSEDPTNCEFRLRIGSGKEPEFQCWGVVYGRPTGPYRTPSPK